LGACNQGAKVARGDYILFLNNDTQVGPGWLSTLTGTASSVQKCGAVGAKLVLPDGTLQEAGSIIWSDATASGYGRGESPLGPEYNYVREVQYCSGACLMVRRDLFERIGGFDKRYAPAYYEEADLCMEITRLGYKVVYQPKVSVIHYEFGSSGRDSAVKLQAENRKKFADKWKSELSTFASPGEKGILKARATGKSAGRVLFIEDRVPDPALGAGYPRSYRMLTDIAALGYEVTCFPMLFSDRPAAVTTALQQLGVEVFYGETDSKLSFEKFFKSRIGYYDIAFVCRPHNMKAVAGLCGTDAKLKIVYDAEAIFALRDIKRQELKGRNVDEKTKASMVRAEVELTTEADAVVTVSEREKKFFIEHGASNVFVAGHVVEPNPTPNGHEARKDLLFVGNLADGSPNEDSVLYFAKEVFPRILKSVDCRLHIVGPNATKAVLSLASESILIAGLVDDLYQYYNSCRLFLAPTRYGAGIPLKVYEASSYGLPSVVSPLIAEQLVWKEGSEVLVGARAESFAEEVVKLYTDPALWDKIRAGCLEAVARDCGPDSFKSNLKSALNLPC
ncbi:MAG: glycosyltransferase, partial [Proteobacteria bacterium]|nr:glycosyltransferase [Pseudomonadota bacterium]